MDIERRVDGHIVRRCRSGEWSCVFAVAVREDVGRLHDELVALDWEQLEMTGPNAVPVCVQSRFGRRVDGFKGGEKVCTVRGGVGRRAEEY